MLEKKSFSPSAFSCSSTLELNPYPNKNSPISFGSICPSIEIFKGDFLPPGYPYIIVSKLTDEIIQAAIQAYIDTEDNSYWLKLYHILPTLDIEDINEILYRKKQENIELESKIDAEVEAD